MIINSDQKKDDWRTRKIVFYDDYDDVKDAGYEVLGEQPKEQAE